MTWTGGEAPGTYKFVFLAVEPGSLADNRIDSWDGWLAAAATVAFHP